MRKYAIAFLVSVFCGAVAVAMVPPITAFIESGSIKTWSTGERLTSSDLNANFNHIHSLMVGGHGGRLVNADVSASAAISYTKIQNGTAIPRAFVEVAATCSASPCTMASSYNVTSVTRSGAGAYDINLAYTATDAAYAVVCGAGSTAGVPKCTSSSSSTTVAQVATTNVAGAATDGSFSVVIFDDN